MESSDMRKSLRLIREQATNEVIGVLNELTASVNSINLMYYQDENGLTYVFSGYDGEDVSVRAIKKEGDEYFFSMLNEMGDPIYDMELSDFNATEMVDLLTMLEEVRTSVNENHNGVVLTEDEENY